jgi:hypothetical protein
MYDSTDQPPWLANQTAFDRFTDPIREQGTRVGLRDHRDDGNPGIAIVLSLLFVATLAGLVWCIAAPSFLSLAAFLIPAFLLVLGIEL